jgi:hypothetical protein
LGIYTLRDEVFIQVLDRTGPLMLNLSGTPYISQDFILQYSVSQYSIRQHFVSQYFMIDILLVNIL